MLTTRIFDKKQLVPFLLIVTLFTFPLSVTLKSIFIPLTILAILFQSSARVDFLKTLREPWCIATLLLFGLMFIGCLFGEADWKSKFAIFNKYSKLLCLPILAMGFQDKRTRQLAIHAFLAAMLLTLILSLLKVAGIITFHSPHAHGPADIFNNHIVTGFFMAFAAYLSALYSKKSQGCWRLGYAVLALLFSIHTLFINTGRTGYVIYALLLAIFLFQCVPLRKIPLYLVLMLPLAGLVISQNTMLTQRIKIALNDVKQYEAGEKNTSLGYRLQFHQYAKKLFLSSPIQGIGTGGFSYRFSQEQPIPAWGEKLLDPHHQYWLMAAENGVIGVSLLLYFFLTLLYVSRKLTETRSIMIALLSAFLVANFLDSFLLFSTTGYFLILFAALCLGEALALSPEPVKRENLQLSEA